MRYKQRMDGMEDRIIKPIGSAIRKVSLSVQKKPVTMSRAVQFAMRGPQPIMNVASLACRPATSFIIRAPEPTHRHSKVVKFPTTKQLTRLPFLTRPASEKAHKNVNANNIEGAGPLFKEVFLI